MEHILLYKWSMSDTPIQNTLRRLGYHVDTLAGFMSDYDHDLNMKNSFLSYFKQCEENGIQCSAVFSTDYFPLISNVCEEKNIIYISWLADYPMSTMYSKNIFNQCNRIFAFDKMEYNELVQMGVKQCFHMPLATDIAQWESVQITSEDMNHYAAEVSFVGNLYNDSESNKYQVIDTFPEYLKGYFDGLIEAQLNVYGYNFIENSLNESIVEEAKKYLELNLGPLYFDVYKKLLSDIINRQISMLERRNVLNRIGNIYSLDLYTGSDVSALTAENIRLKGYADYMTVMPKVFKLSKINLNITSKSIISGIPLRVLDIMGAGGFVLSNYQPEIAEYFENGVEVVLYESMEDLIQKVAYYLAHDEERERIAVAGYEKVRKMYSYEVKLKEILNKAL